MQATENCSYIRAICIFQKQKQYSLVKIYAVEYE